MATVAFLRSDLEGDEAVEVNCVTARSTSGGTFGGFR
jgi:hypothetical protein